MFVNPFDIGQREIAAPDAGLIGDHEQLEASSHETLQRGGDPWENRDFFRTMEEVSGRDLAWFWRGFFYTTAALDQSVEGVGPAPDGSSLVTLRPPGVAPLRVSALM